MEIVLKVTALLYWMLKFKQNVDLKRFIDF